MVDVAQTLVRDPKILIMDEPTANLDLVNEMQVLELVRAYTHKRKTTTLLTLHDLNMAARYADHMILLKDGCVFREGPSSEVITEENIREAYPGITVILVTPKYCVINGEDCMTRDFGGGTLTAYVDAIKTVGAEENIPVIDSFYESGINAENIMDYTGGEGLHFNREGVIFYGDYLGDEILKIMNR